VSEPLDVFDGDSFEHCLGVGLDLPGVDGEHAGRNKQGRSKGRKSHGL